MASWFTSNNNLSGGNDDHDDDHCINDQINELLMMSTTVAGRRQQYFNDNDDPMTTMMATTMSEYDHHGDAAVAAADISQSEDPCSSSMAAASALEDSLGGGNHIGMMDLDEIKYMTVTKSRTRYDQSKKRLEECPNCHSTNIKLQSGSYHCFNCYSLLENIFDESSEWKSGGQNENSANNNGGGNNGKSRLIINPYLPETSNHTYVKGASIGGGRGHNYPQRFHRINNWLIPHHEKSLNIRLHEIDYFGSICNLPGNIIEFAKQIYVEFTELQKIHKKKKSSRGECHNAVLAVILLLSSKEYDVRRSPYDICDSLGITLTDFTKATNLVFSVLQYSELLDISNNQFVVKSADYIETFCRAMGIVDHVIIQDIYQISAKVNQLKILNKNTPQAIACGCIYFVSKMHGLSINRSNFDTKCKVSIPTLNKVYSILIKYTDELIT